MYTELYAAAKISKYTEACAFLYNELDNNYDPIMFSTSSSEREQSINISIKGTVQNWNCELGMFCQFCRTMSTIVTSKI